MSSTGFSKTPVQPVARKGAVGRVVSAVDWAIGQVFRIPVGVYRIVISPLLPSACRFYPSCSAYADEALKLHGGVRGSWLAARRVCRCHPFSEGGMDPVPALLSNANERNPQEDLCAHL